MLLTDKASSTRLLVKSLLDTVLKKILSNFLQIAHLLKKFLTDYLHRNIDYFCLMAFKVARLPLLQDLTNNTVTVVRLVLYRLNLHMRL